MSFARACERGDAGQALQTFRRSLRLDASFLEAQRGTTVVFADRFTPKDERERARCDATSCAASLPQALHGVQHRVMRRPADGCRLRSADPWLERACAVARIRRCNAS